jgi:hypothetical protein
MKRAFVVRIQQRQSRIAKQSAMSVIKLPMLLPVKQIALLVKSMIIILLKSFHVAVMIQVENVLIIIATGTKQLKESTYIKMVGLVLMKTI